MRCNNCTKTIPETSTICPYCNGIVDPNAKVAVTYPEVEVEEKQTFNVQEFVKDKKNKNIVYIAAGVVVVVLVIFILLIASIIGGSKTPSYSYFKKMIDDTMEYIDDNFLSSKYSASGNYNLKLTVNDSINNYSGKYAYDVKNKTILFDGVMETSDEDNSEIVLDYESLKYDVYLKDNILYFGSEDIFNTNILFEIDDSTGLLKTKKYDLYSLVHGFTDAITYTLRDLSYTTSKENIEYIGVNTKVTKVSLVLNNSNKAILYKNFYQNLIDDSNFINETSRITGKKNQEIIDILENYKKSAEYKYQSETTDQDEINIYVSGSRVYRVEYINGNKTYKLDIGDSKYYLSYLENNKVVYSFTLSLVVNELEVLTEKKYEITYKDSTYDIKAVLLLEEDKDTKIKKKEINDYKDIKELTLEEKEIIKNNLRPYVSDISIVDSIADMFKEKCNTSLKCVCKDDEDTCECQYKGSLITCDKTLVTNSVVE